MSDTPMDRLRHHVSGAVERGEKESIVEHTALTAEKVRALSPNGVIAIPRPGKTPERWRVNGALKTWKRSPERFHLPLKHGLYAYHYISDDNLADWQSLGAYIESL